jgi:hypothetical protein
VVGKIGGRRIRLVEGKRPVLLIPNTPDGRRLARLVAYSGELGDSWIAVPWTEETRRAWRDLAGLLSEVRISCAGDASSNSPVEARLRELGVYPRTAVQLAEDGWLTVERINRWWAILSADRRVVKPVGVLVHVLRRREEPKPARTGGRAAAPTSPVETRLLELGVYPGLAAGLAGDEWVTVERINRWWAVLSADPGVVTPAAVLVGVLRRHEEPESPVQAGRDQDAAGRRPPVEAPPSGAGRSLPAAAGPAESRNAPASEPADPDGDTPLHRHLAALGIADPVRSRLIADPWLSHEYVCGWEEYVAHRGRIRQPAAFIAGRLLKRVKPPLRMVVGQRWAVLKWHTGHFEALCGELFGDRAGVEELPF